MASAKVEAEEVDDGIGWPESVQEKLDALGDDRRRRFVEVYVGECFGRKLESALAAGYSPGNRAAAAVTATRLLARPEVRTAVDAILTHLAMGKHEIVARLNQRANATIDDVLDAGGAFDLAKARRNGAVHLVKKLQIDEIRERDVDGEPITIRRYKVEMADPESALDKLAKIHGLYKETLTLQGDPEKPLHTPPTAKEKADGYVELLGILGRLGLKQPDSG